MCLTLICSDLWLWGQKDTTQISTHFASPTVWEAGSHRKLMGSHTSLTQQQETADKISGRTKSWLLWCPPVSPDVPEFLFSYLLPLCSFWDNRKLSSLFVFTTLPFRRAEILSFMKAEAAPTFSPKRAPLFVIHLFLHRENPSRPPAASRDTRVVNAQARGRG